MYTAIQVAKYVITKCTNESQPISNLQLQKILYYIQREFLQFGRQAFSDDIEAWQFGPVVPEVYWHYCGFGSLPISMTYKQELAEEDTVLIDPIVECKRRLKPWDLVAETHRPDRAWSLTYRNGAGNNWVIPVELIRTKG